MNCAFPEHPVSNNLDPNCFMSSPAEKKCMNLDLNMPPTRPTCWPIVSYQYPVGFRSEISIILDMAYYFIQYVRLNRNNWSIQIS